jgi:hypothetical protein
MTGVPRFDEIFDRLERECGVQEWRCGGVRIWPLVKFLLARHLDDYVKSKNLLHLKRGFNLRRKLAYGSRIILDALENRAIERERADICLLTYEAFRQYKVGDSWFNIFQDPLLYICRQLDLRMHTFSLLNIFPERRPPLHRSESLTLAAVSPRLLSRFGLAPRSLRSDVAEVLDCIDGCRDAIELADLNPLKGDVASSVYFLFALAGVFERRLQAVQPRLAVLANYYSVSGLAFCLASHRLGIRSADISHGLSGRYHYAYGGWNRAPQGGYEILPDDFLSRTAEDATALDTLMKGSPDYRKPIVVGDLAAQAWRDDAYSITAEPRRILAGIKEREPRGNGRLEVLIALQNIEGLSPLYIDVMEQTKDWCFYWIRFHPSYLADIQHFSMPARAGRFNMMEATSQPLFAILERADVVMTETSSVAEDARLWNVPAVITHPFGQALFRDHIEIGRMMFATTVGDVTAALQRRRDARTTGAGALPAEMVRQRRDLEAYLVRKGRGTAPDRP